VIWETQYVHAITMPSNVCVLNKYVSSALYKQTAQPLSPCSSSFLFSCRNRREAHINPLEVTDRQLSTAQPPSLKMDIVAAHSAPGDDLRLQVLASICLVRLMQ
jgi:hypothetical protein